MLPTKMKPFTNNDRVLLFNLFLNAPDADHDLKWFTEVAVKLNAMRVGYPIQLSPYHIAGIFRSIQETKQIVLK